MGMELAIILGVIVAAAAAWLKFGKGNLRS
jgi:hypothetical protein